MVYFPPQGWERIGLNVCGLYEDDQWLEKNNSPGEWAVGFVGTTKYIFLPQSDTELIQPIKFYENDIDINEISDKKYYPIGQGNYFTKRIELSEKNACISVVDNKMYKMIF